MEKCAIGIDLGGTSIKGIIMGPEGEGRCLSRVPTEAQKGGAQVLQNLLRLVEQLIAKERKENRIIGVGIGTPGFVNDDGTVIGGAENLPGWKGTHLGTPIMERFGLRAVAANDVTVAALAEAKYGAGRGVRNMVCFALGTGIGGGLVLEGKLYKGSHGMAGELGHLPVETNGIPCNCGQRGCLERYASAPGIAAMAKTMCAGTPSGEATPFVSYVKKYPDAVTSKLVYNYVNKNDPVALRVHERVCDMLARGIGTMVNALSPDRVVLGGGVMMAGQIIVDAVTALVPKYCIPTIWERCTIVAAELGENAGALGAGAMAFETFGE